MLFNTSQRKGILVLLFFITCLIVLPRQFLRTDYNLFLINDTLPIPRDSVVPIKKAIYKKTPVVGHSVKLELNTADSVSLDALRGIGPYYAGKIIRYRKQLGGYCSVSQLKELKMTYFNVDSCAHLFSVDPSLIIKRDLNTMSFKEVLSHPYLEYEDVKLIFNAKRAYQNISYTILENKKVLPAYKLKKIKPYFK